jgi:hypothetical protein
LKLLQKPFIIFSPISESGYSVSPTPVALKKSHTISLLSFGAALSFFSSNSNPHEISIFYWVKKNFIDNFKTIFPILGIEQDPAEIKRIIDYGAIIDTLIKLPPDSLEKIEIQMVKHLIRKRILEKYRLLDTYYLIAIDATQNLMFKGHHCDHCLRKKTGFDESGEPVYSYYHYVLEAKLVTPDGLTVSVMSEFIENESPDVSKQDCELNAFYRLAPRLKNYFPKTNFCLLLDSLYANQNVFNRCRTFSWQYMIRFKQGSIPTVFQEYLDCLPFFSENNGKHPVNKNKRQDFRWVNDIEYQGNNLHILECNETVIAKNENPKTTKFIWISSFKISELNYEKLANKGGRCRWKIENQGFKKQKKEGYGLEHAYSLDCNAIKCFYYFLQIAYSINQLIEHGDLIGDIPKKYGSIKNFTAFFWEAFVNHLIEPTKIQQIMSMPFQIRFNSS